VKTRIQFINLVFAMAACIVPCRVAFAATPFLVNGEIHTQIIQGDPNRTPRGAELEAQDMWEGSLVGAGISHVFGTELLSQGAHGDLTATQKLFTTDGNLFFNQVGERVGLNTFAVSVVSGGTGIFNGATGTLTLTGHFVGGGRVDWVYSGIIDLED